MHLVTIIINVLCIMLRKRVAMQDRVRHRARHVRWSCGYAPNLRQKRTKHPRYLSFQGKVTLSQHCCVFQKVRTIKACVWTGCAFLAARFQCHRACVKCYRVAFSSVLPKNPVILESSKIYFLFHFYLLYFIYFIFSLYFHFLVGLL